MGEPEAAMEWGAPEGKDPGIAGPLRLVTAFAILASLTLASACSSAPKAQARAQEASKTSADSVVVPPTVRPPAPPPPRQPASRKSVPISPAVVEIVPEGEDDGPRHLVDVAQEEKLRRQRTSQPEVQIDNENLGEYAADGDLTFVQDTDTSAGDALVLQEQEALQQEEEQWRNRILETRVRWSETVEEIGRLESEAAELRQRFYREDDPFVRDRQIKPEWDRVLSRLGEARDEARVYQAQVERVLNDAEEAGADPAWLQEGVYLEPPVETYEDDDATSGSLDRHQVVDPPEQEDP